MTKRENNEQHCLIRDSRYSTFPYPYRSFKLSNKGGPRAVKHNKTRTRPTAITEIINYPRARDCSVLDARMWLEVVFGMCEPRWWLKVDGPDELGRCLI